MAIKYVDLKVGYDCNNSCIHCVIADQRDRAKQLRGNENRSTQEFFDELLESKKNGCSRVIITGGEPTIRKDFFDLVKFSKENDFEVLLQSNGRAFSSKKYLDNVKDYIDMYMIALHGSISEIHDKITRAPNGYNQTIDAIKNLVSIDAKLGIKVVLSIHNYKDLLNIVKLVNSLEVKYVNIAFPHANGSALKYFDEIVPNYSEIEPYIQELIDYSNFENFNLDFEAILPCALKKDNDLKFFTDLKIQVNSCELKQLDESSLDWTNLRIDSKKKGLTCMKCIFNGFCEGYWREYVEFRGFNEFRPVTKLTPELKEIFLSKFKSWKK